MTIKDRIQKAKENALSNFWGTVAAAFPEATTGDFPPDADENLDSEAQSAIELWVELNVPEDVRKLDPHGLDEDHE